MWDAFGADKQQGIQTYFEISMPWFPNSDTRPDVDPRIFDLFGFYERQEQDS